MTNNLEKESWEKRFDKQFEGYWRGQAIPDEIKFFIKKTLAHQKQELIAERDQQIASWIEVPVKNTDRDGVGPIGCNKCGGALYKIRAKHPPRKEDIMKGRLVCPTCAVEILEDVLSNLYPNNVPQAAKNTH